MGALSEYKNSVRFLKTIRRICAQVIETERPRIKYGIVESIDYTTRTAMVLYVGEVDSVKVPFGFIAPTSAGDKVRVDGPKNDRYIVDVLPGAEIDFTFVEAPPPDPDPPTPGDPTEVPTDPDPIPDPQAPEEDLDDPDPDDGDPEDMAFNYITTGGSSQTLDWSLARNRKIKLTAATCTLTFSNPVDGGRYQLHVIQDATGGRKITWPSSVVWAGDSPPALTPTPNRRDVLTFVYDSATSKYYGTPTLNFQA